MAAVSTAHLSLATTRKPAPPYAYAGSGIVQRKGFGWQPQGSLHRAGVPSHMAVALLRKERGAAGSLQASAVKKLWYTLLSSDGVRRQSLFIRAEANEAPQTTTDAGPADGGVSGEVGGSSNSGDPARAKTGEVQNGNGSSSSSNPFTPGKLSSRLGALAAQPAASTGKPSSSPSTALSASLTGRPEEPSGPRAPTPAASTTSPLPPPSPSKTGPPKSPFGAPPGMPGQALKAGATAAPGRLSTPAVSKLQAGSSVKPTPSFSGKKVLAAFKDGDKFDNKVKIGQPRAPSSIFDDPRRTAEEIEAEKWRLSISREQLLLVLSFFASSIIMFGTVWVVWKLGAIHFNEY